jgi:hypothetical protein
MKIHFLILKKTKKNHVFEKKNPFSFPDKRAYFVSKGLYKQDVAGKSELGTCVEKLWMDTKSTAHAFKMSCFVGHFDSARSATCWATESFSRK